MLSLEGEISLYCHECGSTDLRVSRLHLRDFQAERRVHLIGADGNRLQPQPCAGQIDARLEEIRTDLPLCVRANCASESGWNAFLAQHELSKARVERYLRNRLEILSFIELRFRQGIRITPEEIETYYRETLLPQYPSGQTPPPLQQVSSRIEEILLQQRVNALFDTWLSNLRSQGQIQVLDPSLERASAAEDGATRE